ncbi:leucine-rich repeat-containing protein 7-like, partial [Notothenia coriiceps]|uniref:Leucine-rich repeat-containing protein 7-like n=1 Tax=Notothenia coriiceps TaxID=8208 RepID=A0A6I9NMF4_9TELE
LDVINPESKALIPLQTEAHPETKQKVLTNYMFPQQPRHDEDYQSDSDSFNPILWEEQRQQRMTVAFDFDDKKEEEDNSGKVKVEINLKRYPTPYPEDLKNMVKSVQSLVGKSVHGGHGHQHQHQHQLQHQHQHQLSTGTATSAGTNMEHTHLSKEYEPPWPLPPKESLKVHPTFHVSKLKPVVESRLVHPPTPPPPPRVIDGGIIYTVSALPVRVAPARVIVVPTPDCVHLCPIA